MEMLIDPFLNHFGIPTATTIPGGFRSRLDNLNQRLFLAFGQSRWSAHWLSIPQAFPSSFNKTFQPVVDGLPAKMPRLHKCLQSLSTGNRQQHCDPPYQSPIFHSNGLTHSLAQMLDGFFLKGYSRHGTLFLTSRFGRST